MDPYVKGALLRRELKPKQLRLPPDEVHLGPGAVDFLEWSILRRYVHTWLEYLAWYAQQSVHPLLNLGLMVQTSWKIKDEDPQLKRFGLLWKIFDLIIQYKMNKINPPRAITDKSCMVLGTWISGGLTGKDFLVCARGLNQPRAQKGVVVLGESLDPTSSKAIRNKTLGLTERQQVVGYSRRNSDKKFWDYF